MITNINEFKKSLIKENITIDKIENFISGYDNALVLFFDVQEITEGDEIYEIINTIAIANDCEIHCVCNNTIVLVSNELDGDHGQLSNLKSALTLEAKNNTKLSKVLKINEDILGDSDLFKDGISQLAQMFDIVDNLIDEGYLTYDINFNLVYPYKITFDDIKQKIKNTLVVDEDDFLAILQDVKKITLYAKQQRIVESITFLDTTETILKKLFKMFTDINKDAKENGESVVKFSDIGYYTDQIFNIYFEDKVKKDKSNEDELYKKAKQQARDLAKYAKEQK